jgi:hypothetical protein
MAATARVATMTHAADAATAIRPERRRGRALQTTGDTTGTGTAYDAACADPDARTPLSIGDSPDRRAHVARAASGGVSARRSAYRSAGRLTSPPTGSATLTIPRGPGASTRRKGAHLRQAPSPRFQQSAQQAAPQVGQSR